LKEEKKRSQTSKFEPHLKEEFSKIKEDDPTFHFGDDTESKDDKKGEEGIVPKHIRRITKSKTEKLAHRPLEFPRYDRKKRRMEEEKRKHEKIILPGFDTENLVLSKKVINIEINARTDEDEHFIPRYVRRDRRSKTTKLKPSEIRELYKKVAKAEDKIKPIDILKERPIFDKHELDIKKPKVEKVKVEPKEEKRGVIEKKDIIKPKDKMEKVSPKKRKGKNRTKRKGR